MQTGHQHIDNLLYACVANHQRGNEQFVPDHALGYIISGETRLFTNEGRRVFAEGSIGLVRRNQLIKSVKVPPQDGAFRAINILFDQEFLCRYAATNNIKPPAERYKGDGMLLLPPDPFLKGYFNSLIPYFENQAQPKASLAQLKTQEALELLLRANPALGALLFDFSEPHKIDLEAYMNQNYMYNVPALQFAKLTGRSLAGFKRDFEKTFAMPPGQWLLQKRLHEARFLITEKGRKPSDVYLEVGFENLSHFSYSFKKAYGVAPSVL